MLVDAPAAIEEAVALLLATSDAPLRHAACLTYIHRLYSAFLVTPPAALAEGFKAYQWLYDAGVGSGVRPILFNKKIRFHRGLKSESGELC